MNPSEMGKRGAYARAASLKPEQRKAIASAGGKENALRWKMKKEIWYRAQRGHFPLTLSSRIEEDSFLCYVWTDDHDNEYVYVPGKGLLIT